MRRGGGAGCALCTMGAGSPGSSPGPTFCVVLVQLVGRLFPVLDALLQRVDEALQQRAVGGAGGSGPPAGSPCAPPTRPPVAPTHLVNCRSLVSMLRWRMHMRVSAEPISRVAPGEASTQLGKGPAGASAVPASATRGRAGPQRPSSQPVPRPQNCAIPRWDPAIY